MAVRARFRSRDGSIQGERVVHDQLPVRLGRSPLNDVVLMHPFVSEFHAVIENVDGRPCIRDLNSRNGIYDRNNARLPPSQPIPLSDLGDAFLVGRAVDVQIEAFEMPPGFGDRASAVRGSVLGNFHELEAAWGAGGSSQGVAPLPPLSMGAPTPGGMGPRSPSPSSPAFAPSFSAPVGPARAAPLSPSLQPPSLPPLQPLSGGLRPSAMPPGGPVAPGPAPLRRGPDTAHLTMATEALALVGLRELAASLVPGVPLESTGDVARLVTKLHDLVEVFCRCFLAMRDLQGAARPLAYEGPHLARIAAAADPALLAATLLDWRNRSFDAADSIERLFTELVMRQAAVVDQVLSAVRSLLAELSPESIERAVSEKPGVGAVLNRHRALWSTFSERFAEIADDDKLLERIMGPEAAASHRRRGGYSGPR